MFCLLMFWQDPPGAISVAFISAEVHRNWILFEFIEYWKTSEIIHYNF